MKEVDPGVHGPVLSNNVGPPHAFSRFPQGIKEGEKPPMVKVHSGRGQNPRSLFCRGHRNRSHGRGLGGRHVCWLTVPGWIPLRPHFVV